MSTNISNININMNNVKINVKENMIYESNFCKILVERNTLKPYFWHLPALDSINHSQGFMLACMCVKYVSF